MSKQKIMLLANIAQREFLNNALFITTNNKKTNVRQ